MILEVAGFAHMYYHTISFICQSYKANVPSRPQSCLARPSPTQSEHPRSPGKIHARQGLPADCCEWALMEGRTPEKWEGQAGAGPTGRDHRARSPREGQDFRSPSEIYRAEIVEGRIHRNSIGRTPNIANHDFSHLKNIYWLKLFFLLLFNLLTCPAFSGYNFWLKNILTWEILSLLCIPILPNST